MHAYRQWLAPSATPEDANQQSSEHLARVARKMINKYAFFRGDPREFLGWITSEA